MLQRIQKFLFPPPVSDAEALRTFLTGESAYLAQKAVFGYCRVKTMLDYDKLMTETPFRVAIEACRWEAFASALADSIILVEGWLRPAEPKRRQILAESLGRLYAVILAAEPMPSHRQDWDDCIAAFAQRYALSCQTEPARPEQVVAGTAELIFQQVPIHKRLKREDLEVILGDLRLHMLAMHASMLKRFRREDVVAALAG